MVREVVLEQYAFSGVSRTLAKYIDAWAIPSSFCNIGHVMMTLLAINHMKILTFGRRAVFQINLFSLSLSLYPIKSQYIHLQKTSPLSLVSLPCHLVFDMQKGQW